MRSVRLNDPKLWSEILLLLQILSTLAAFYGLSRIGGVHLLVELPTPTCPQGIDSIYMPLGQQVQCSEERLALYLPNWLILFSRTAIVLSGLCMISGSLVWLICKLRGSERRKPRVFIYQAGAFAAALFLHATLIYPGNLGTLVRFVLNGSL